MLPPETRASTDRDHEAGWQDGLSRREIDPDEAVIAVPRQLSVIGFDNIVAPYLTPPLCSFDPHLYDVGARAATLLAAALRGQLATPQRILMPLDFVCRASCGPPSW